MILELLCGPIASGKSTYARKRAKEGAVIVNDDAIVLAVHAGNYRLYTPTLKPLYKTIEHTMIMSALTVGRDVVVDRTCGERGTRMRYVSIAHSFATAAHCTVFPREDPRVHAERRFRADPRGMTFDEWLRVAELHDSHYTEPDLSEGFDYIRRQV